jgi:sporulation protein YlmC with PRC-barrel domain
MLRSVKELFGYQILATDGDIGKVYDFFFDDETWTIRYLVVDIGTWLPERKVLLSPVALLKPEGRTHKFPIRLSKEQVRKSPDINVEKPVSMQYQIALHAYYGWPVFWPMSGYTPVPPVTEEQPPFEPEKEDSHLRSIREVKGYHIQATDREIGHVEDFIANDADWNIRYMVVDTRNWLPGKWVLIPLTFITDVRWIDRSVYIDLTKESVKNSPEYNPSDPVNREYEARLYDYYGRPYDS